MTPEEEKEHQKLLEDLIKRTHNELIDALMKAYRLETPDVASAVELYYDAQGLRIQHANKKRTEAPRTLNIWMDKWLGLGELFFHSKLKEWVTSDRAPAEARWALSQIGIGPVIASGLAAHIDIVKAQTPSAVWKFSGLAPGFDRKVKKQKLPYNARLKVLAWKLGESFVKVSGKEDAVYGKLYAEFKAEEIARNKAGKYAEAAARELATKKISDKDTRAKLESGMLTDGHLHARAKRRAVKVFLCHYWIKGRLARGLPIRDPWIKTYGGHQDMILPADGSETTATSERAKISEKPEPTERANTQKTSEETKRASDTEKTKTSKRATRKEPPDRHERAA